MTSPQDLIAYQGFGSGFPLSSAMPTDLNDSSRFQFIDEINPDFAPASIFPKVLASLANPIATSASFGYGTKATVNDWVAFSVGNSGDLKTNDRYGRSPKITILNGIMSFNTPQTNPYVGIGDRVTYGSSECYLKQKIDAYSWRVVKVEAHSVEHPDNIPNEDIPEPVDVVSIEKAFETLKIAVELGIPESLGTKSAAAIKRDIYIALYEMQDTVDSSIDVSGWTMLDDDDEYRLKIFCPYRPDHCNTRQLRKYVLSPSASFASGAVLDCDQNNIDVEGLSFSRGSASNTLDAYIRLHDELSTVSRCSIVGDSSGPGDGVGIHVVGSAVDTNVFFNFVSDTAGGILVDPAVTDVFYIHNNTVREVTGTGIEVPATPPVDAFFYNNIVNGSLVSDYAPNIGNWQFCLASDASCSNGTSCVTNKTLNFIDDGHEIDNSDIPSCAGEYLFVPDEDYAIPALDYNGDIIDDTWLKGVIHKTPVIYLSVGYAGNLRTGTPSAAITNGILVFSSDQDNAEISAGCKVTFSDAQVVYLVRKMNDGDYTTWSIISANGSIPVDKLSTSVTSITHATDTLCKALTDSGSSSPMFVDMLGSSDLIGSDRAIHIMCVSGITTVTSHARSITCDFARRIRVSAPTRTGEANGPDLVKWHSGSWNGNLFSIDTVGDDGIINVNVDNLLIENLQIQDAGNGISVIGGAGTSILNNMIRQCSNGVLIGDGDGNSPLHVVAGNIIYECSSHGIRINEDIGDPAFATFVGVSATWALNSIRSDGGFGSYEASVVVAPGDPVITWGAKSVTIRHDGTLTMAAILSSAVVNGAPWGIINPGVGGAVDALSPIQLAFASSFTEGNPGISNIYFAVYNNTVVGCGTGLFLESSVSDKYRNAIRCINNLAIKSAIRDYDGTSRHSRLIVMESCWASDKSTNDFNSRKCEVVRTPIFRDESRHDFHINLHDAMSMFDAWNLDNDSWHSVDMDVDHKQNWGTLKRFSIGADAYGFPLGRVIPCSVGASTAIKTGNVKLFADGGIIRFDSAVNITSDEIGVGDTVVFTDSMSGTVTYQLFDRGSETVWSVCNVDGTIPTLVDNGPSDEGCVVDSIERVSPSLDDAMHGTDIETLIGGRDLTSLGASLLVECYKDTPIDDAPASIDSWTTSSEQTIRIEVPYTLNKSLMRQRHFGKNDDLSYRIKATSGNNAIHIQSSNVFLEGIICLGSDSPTILIDDVVDNIGIDRFIIAGGSKGIQKVGLVGTADVSFSTIYDCTGEGIDGSGFESFNVTIVDCDTGFNTATGACTNCLSQCVTLDFNALSMENCISADATATETGCRNGVIVDFKDPSTKDFHLARSDVSVIRYGKSLTAFTCDVDSRLVGGNWSVGSDCGPFPTLNVFFAARNGFVGTNIITGTNVKIDVTDGVARFYDSVTDDSVEQTNAFFGIGCEITYGSTNKLYISEKVSFHKDRWRVTTRYGEVPSDVVGQTVTQVTYNFGNLATLFASGLSDFMNGPSPYAFNDLVRAGLNITIVGYRGDNTTSVVSITGWEQNDRNRLTLLVPYDTDRHCNTVQRASGTRLGVTSECAISITTGATAALTIGSSFTVIDGLSILSYLLADAISVGAVDGVVVKDCFVFGCKNGIVTASGRVGYFINNVIYNAINSGIVCSGRSVVLNNTVHDCTTGHCINNSSSDVVINTIAGQSGVSGFNDNDYIQACVSYDASAGIRNKCRQSIPMDFVDVTDVDKSKWDFNLMKTFTDVRGTGIQMLLNQYHPFGIDQSGWIRGRLWDIGAMEYRANRHVAYSVFTASLPYNLRDYKTSDVGALMVRVDDENGVSIAKFYDSVTGEDVPQVSPFIGIGDIVEAGIYDIHLLEKKSSSRWVVTDRIGDPTSSIAPVAVSKIRRAFKSADVAFGASGILSANYADTNSLVNDEIQIDVAFYRDEYGIASNSDYAAIRINSMPTDVDYFFRLFTPNDLSKHCNEIQSHTGIVGTGYRNYTLWGQPSAAILLTGLYNTEILRMDVSNPYGDGIKCVSCRNTVIESCIVSSCDGNGISNPTQTLSLDAMINNLVWGNRLDGIRVGNKTDFGYSEVYIANNTIDQNRRALIVDKPATTPRCGRVYVYNTIGQRSKWVDFAEDHIEIYGWVVYERCVSQDDTAGTVAGYNNQANVEVAFSDRANRKYHLNRLEDIELINNGADLHAGSVYSFNYDIANRPRPDTLWDIGAFEFIELIGAGSLCIGETVIAANLAMILEEPPVLNLYLRKNLDNHKKPAVPIAYQFNSIGGRLHPVEPDCAQDPAVVSLNEYLTTQNLAARIIVHVEPNSRFEGSFDFGVRPSLSVLVQTDLEDYLSIDENDRQPAGVYYCQNAIGLYDDAPLIADTSKTLYSEFRSIKMAGRVDNLLGASTQTRDLRLINCVTQIEGDALIPDVECDLTIINSDIIFSVSTGPFELTKHAASQRFIANTMLLASSASPLSILTGAGRVDSCLTYNYGGGGFTITDISSSLYNCKVNANPLFTSDTTLNDLSDSYRVVFGDTPEDYAQQKFRTSKSSPVLDAGDNSYVNGKDLGAPTIHIDAVVTDATGARRIFDSEYPRVDIGIHELRVYRFDITSDSIFRLYQDKLSYSSGAFYPSARTAPYLDLAETFDTDDERLEFARESKVVMEVNRPTETVRLKTDKVFTVLVTIGDVRIDERTMSIVIPKIPSNAGYLFSRILDDDRYLIRFDEIAKTLTVHLKSSYNKGLSGSRNPIRNVKFGGSPIYMG